MDKPVPQIAYMTTDARSFRDPTEAANHELTVQIENFLEGYLGNSVSYSRYEVVDVLRGKRKQLAELLAFDYTPDPVVLKAPEIARAPGWGAPKTADEGEATPAQNPFRRPEGVRPAFPLDFPDGGMSDEDLEKAIRS